MLLPAVTVTGVNTGLMKLLLALPRFHSYLFYFQELLRVDHANSVSKDNVNVSSNTLTSSYTITSDSIANGLNGFMWSKKSWVQSQLLPNVPSSPRFKVVGIKPTNLKIFSVGAIRWEKP